MAAVAVQLRAREVIGAAGNAGDDHQRVVRFDRRLDAPQFADLLVVDEDVDVVAQLALFGVEVTAQARMLRAMSSSASATVAACTSTVLEPAV